MMADKMLITGGTGLLGSELAGFFSAGYDIYSVSSKDFDIGEIEPVRSYFNEVRPDIVLHAAAVADVDRCEADEKLAMAVNAVGTENIAGACAVTKARMVYYSTDYVFDGTKDSPYVESDNVNPVNIYGRSKLEGEKRAVSILEDCAILRVAWLYSKQSRSFVNRLVRRGREQLEAKKAGKEAEAIKMVSDQVGTPTWTFEVARQTKIVLDEGLCGLFHCTAGGEASRFDLARFVFEKLSMDVDLLPCSIEEFPWKAPRPKYTPLVNMRLDELGLNIMRDCREALNEFLRESRRQP